MGSRRSVPEKYTNQRLEMKKGPVPYLEHI
jgi:hypothetical protein